MDTLKSNGLSNTVIGTLAVDGWAVRFGTARRRLGGLRRPPNPFIAVPNVTAHPSTASVPTSFYIIFIFIYYNGSTIQYKTRRALGRAHVPPTKVFPRLAVNKPILKPRLAAATGAQYLYVGFSQRNKIPRCSAYDIGKSNPVPASGL